MTSNKIEPLARRRRWAGWAALAAITSAAISLAPGCSGGDEPIEGDAKRGAELYMKLCASCHGPRGEGGVGVPLNAWTRGYTELVQIIDATMPLNNASQCTGQCAKDIAAYILSGFESCSELPHGPRKLRLLNRREYNATVRDLFNLGEGPAGGVCMTDADCDIEHASCAGGACVADPCNLHTFVLPANGQSYNTVHIAGTFNNWPGTVAAGGWPMTFIPSKNLWVAKHTLDNGSYQYKFVINESNWVADPNNDVKVPDGFGGDNSVLNLGCSSNGGASAAYDWAKDFPVESRPKGFGYDNNVDAGLVTSVHVEQYMKAAETLADKLSADIGAILPCDPGPDPAACATQFASEFGRRAFRRPLSNAEIEKYKTRILAQPSFEQGLRVALQIMLSSPHFLYRFEMGQSRGDGTFALTPHEIAAALSYTFWGTMPDQGLFDAADSGALSNPAGIEKEARRLLADPRSRGVSGVFALQWLGVERVLTADKNSSMFPTYDQPTRDALAEETRRFFNHVVFEGTGKYDELFTADYTFANDKTAALYGISGPSTSNLEQVSAPDARQAGILGHGSVLASYAHSDQTSPIRRGLFIREHILCQEFGPPPPNAGGVPDVDPNATTRDRFHQHTENATCRSCHQYIDEIGFGFERFDPIGEYRETENGKPIDPSGDMNDVEKMGSGTHAPFATLPELGTILASSESAKACFARQYHRFATGRQESLQDLCALDSVAQDFAAGGYDIRELMIAIVKSPSFTVRK